MTCLYAWTLITMFPSYIHRLSWGSGCYTFFRWHDIPVHPSWNWADHRRRTSLWRTKKELTVSAQSFGVSRISFWKYIPQWAYTWRKREGSCCGSGMLQFRVKGNKEIWGKFQQYPGLKPGIFSSLVGRLISSSRLAAGNAGGRSRQEGNFWH